MEENKDEIAKVQKITKQDIEQQKTNELVEMVMNKILNGKSKEDL